MPGEETREHRKATAAGRAPGKSARSVQQDAEIDAEQRSKDTLALVRRLAGKPASEVLARISDGDMLRLYPLSARRIRDSAFILDVDRVFERALAEAAVGIELDAEGCTAEAWLLERIDAAIQSGSCQRF